MISDLESRPYGTDTEDECENDRDAGVLGYLFTTAQSTRVTAIQREVQDTGTGE